VSHANTSELISRIANGDRETTPETARTSGDPAIHTKKLKTHTRCQPRVVSKEAWKKQEILRESPTGEAAFAPKEVMTLPYLIVIPQALLCHQRLLQHSLWNWTRKHSQFYNVFFAVSETFLYIQRATPRRLLLHSEQLVLHWDTSKFCYVHPSAPQTLWPYTGSTCVWLYIQSKHRAGLARPVGPPFRRSRHLQNKTLKPQRWKGTARKLYHHIYLCALRQLSQRI